jgi:hypothetical protein
MLPLHSILYCTIKHFELRERIRRQDFTFDAFGFVSRKLGHKNPTTLRKMCEPRQGNTAKLGVEEALIIMNLTGDYRLFAYLVQKMKGAYRERIEQRDLFDEAQEIMEQFLSENDKT